MGSGIWGKYLDRDQVLGGKTKVKGFRRQWLAGLLAAGLLLLSLPPAAAGKNIFLMIADGAGIGAWDLTELYPHRRRTASPYFGPEFKKFLMTTFPLPPADAPGDQGYDPRRAWEITRTGGGLRGAFGNFQAYVYLQQMAPDSAASATAMATGQKTSNGAINWRAGPLSPTIAELAKEQGYVTGIVTTVPWSHATPACFSNARHPHRHHYGEIARQMLTGNTLDLIMGAGHPQWDDNGTQVHQDYRLVGEAAARYVGGGETWRQLVEGRHPGAWRLLQTKEEFEELARMPPAPLPARILGTARAATTLQQRRRGASPSEKVGETPLNHATPSLLTLTQGAVNFLSAKARAQQKRGFFLCIEGGAVDWAAHQTQAARLIEELRDFNQAVFWVISWIEAHGGWENHLLLITSDHGTGLPLGPDSDKVPFARLEYEHVKEIPLVRWHTTRHTRELVPLFARGSGADHVDFLVRGQDPYFARFYPDWAAAGFDGRYLDNTDLFQVLKAALTSCQGAREKGGPLWEPPPRAASGQGR